MCGWGLKCSPNCDSVNIAEISGNKGGMPMSLSYWNGNKVVVRALNGMFNAMIHIGVCRDM